MWTGHWGSQGLWVWDSEAMCAPAGPPLTCLGFLSAGQALWAHGPAALVWSSCWWALVLCFTGGAWLWRPPSSGLQEGGLQPDGRGSWEARGARGAACAQGSGLLGPAPPGALTVSTKSAVSPSRNRSCLQMPPLAADTMPARGHRALSSPSGLRGPQAESWVPHPIRSRP